MRVRVSTTAALGFFNFLFPVEPFKLGFTCEDWICVRKDEGQHEDRAACSVAVKLLDLDLQGRWFDHWCGHEKICTAVVPLSKALNPTLLQGVCLLLSLINCMSLWIKASAK